MVCGLQRTTAQKLIGRIATVTKFHGGVGDRLGITVYNGFFGRQQFFFKVVKFHFIITKLQKCNTTIGV